MEKLKPAASVENEKVTHNQAETESDETAVEHEDAPIMEDNQEEIAEVREKIAHVRSPEVDRAEEKDVLREKEERVSAYIDKHFPEYLEKGETSAVYKIFKSISKLALGEVQGREKLPEGAKLFIANHRGGETGRLIAALEDPVHIVSAETINWDNDRAGAFRWLMKKLGMVPVRETFSNLDTVQKQEVVEKSRVSERSAHQKVAEGAKGLGGGNIQNIRAMVALLLSGDDVALFSEGPFSRLEDDERRSYAGYALVAREYKKITGEDLDIVPTGISKNAVAFGESLHVDQEGRQSKEELQDMATREIHALYDALQ